MSRYLFLLLCAFGPLVLPAQAVTQMDSAIIFQPQWAGPNPRDTAGRSWPNPNDFVLVEREPVAINLSEVLGEISFDEDARNFEGKVIFRILLDERGNYVKHIVLRTSHPLYSKPVEKVLPEIRFSPAFQSGRAIPYWITFPFQACWRE